MNVAVTRATSNAGWKLNSTHSDFRRIPNKCRCFADDFPVADR